VDSVISIGGRRFLFRDPDGNVVTVVGHLRS
jgi:hypothetical protein